MKATCIILALVAVLALAFGLSATSKLGANEAQMALLQAQLDQAQKDLALSEDINRAFEKERTSLQGAIDDLENGLTPVI